MRRILVGALVFTHAELSLGACPPGEAQKSYDDARSAFEEHRYDESIELLRRAYACEPNRVYLANVARAHEEANRPKEALAAWKEYLATLDDEAEKRATEGRMSVLTKLIERLDRLEREKLEAERKRREPVRSRAPRRRATPRESSPEISTGAWVVTGASGVALLGGFAFAFVGRSKHSAAVDEPDVDRANEKQDSAKSFTRIANFTFVGAAVLAVAGGIWIGVDLSRNGEARIGGRF